MFLWTSKRPAAALQKKEASMARRSNQVTYAPTDSSRIPDLLVEGTSLLMDLQQRGIVTAAGAELRIRRQGGYSALDLWLVLLVFYTAGAHVGMRAFWDVLRPVVAQVAAAVGRRRLPSPASVSRALGAVELEQLRRSSDWILAHSTGIDAVLSHPVVQTRDACGDGWHVFDLDPTVTTLRHRALPSAEDLPEPVRRSEATGVPGHRGRKRGDIVHRRVTVQHSGSGAWLHAHLSSGNGDGVADLELALDTIGRTCDRLGHSRARALVRMDGEYGNVPSFTACRERNLPFVTRLNRPKLFDDPAVLDQLRQATWYQVPDSGSGPRRAAADLGIFTIAAGQRTRRQDDGLYAPITVRVVASAFSKSGDAKRGRTLDGRQVELFAADLPPEAWPAPEAVAAYFGRVTQENRFAQEDRELGLDRIVSYHLPGQEMAALVGLAVWNLRIARGFELAPPSRQLSVQPLRDARVDETIEAGWPRDPVVRKKLIELDWDTLLTARPGWSFSQSTGELLCESDRTLTLTTVRKTEHSPGRTGLIFRRPTGGCTDCDARPGCLRSPLVTTPKHVEFSVPTSVAEPLRTRLAAVRRPNRGMSIGPVDGVDGRSGPHAVDQSLFLPAAARQLFRDLFAGATLRVVVDSTAILPPRTHLVAVDAADRQRRRKTWKQNADRYALPDETVAHITVEGAQSLRILLGEKRPSTTTAQHVA